YACGHWTRADSRRFHSVSVGKLRYFPEMALELMYFVSRARSNRSVRNSMSSAAPSQSSGPRVEIHVWDGFVRVFHWTLVLAFTVAYLTEDDLLTVHVWAGYAVSVLIVARLV